ncbi:MAG: CDF family Co(II)/Ni(II) efflux transporter DmeF [Caulobacteraceae bacterium]|nr:CDF family Co(II)/Ni(II) efflux transporter DmeF [Caulobacter sp.]
MADGGAFPAEPPAPPAAGPPRASAHDHVFLGRSHAHHERRTRWVVALSLVVMVAELAGGFAYRSVALIADGLHMSTHAGALLVAAAAYAYARRAARDPRFGWGVGKVGDLAGFASGVGLLIVALLIAVESVERLLHPEPVAFLEAAAVAALGFVVSLASAVLLRHDHGREGRRGHAHERDHNVWAAYLHMVADVVTSLLTVGALLIGYATGWVWMDPLTGLLGAALVASFAVALLRRAGAVLLDMRPDATLVDEARRRLEADGDVVGDLHVWRVGPGHLALLAQVATASQRRPDDYRARLASLPELSHVTIEVEPPPRP